MYLKFGSAAPTVSRLIRLLGLAAYSRLLSVGIGVLLLGAASAASRAQVTNGDFSTGDLTGWTSFTTANGTANAGGSPDVQMFNVTGSGTQDAAHFNVGHLSGMGGTDPEGGGIFQNITLGAGSATITADIAANVTVNIGNVNGGNFEMLLDGSVVATDSVGFLFTGGPFMGTLSATETVTAGSHELEFEVLRPATAVAGLTPDQYITNVAVNVSAQPSGAPEPGSFGLLLGIGSVMTGLRRRARARG